MSKTLTDQATLDSYHDESREIVSLALYPSVPEDIADWAAEVIPDKQARENFLEAIGEEYSIELMVDKNTGEFNIAAIII